MNKRRKPTQKKKIQKNSEGRGKLILFIILGIIIVGGLVAVFLFRNALQNSINQAVSPVSQDAKISTALTEDGQVELAIPKNSKITASIAAQDKAKWPEKAIGGLYQITTSSEKFDSLVSVKIQLDSYPGAGFSLGYYNSQTKQWEYIPTISRSLKLYEGFLLHASEVAGYQTTPAEAIGSSGAPAGITTEQQKDLAAIRQKLDEIANKNLTGEGATDKDWEVIGEILKRLAQQAIDQCIANQTPENQRFFYYIWSIVQMLGFDELDNQFRNAEQKCRPQREIPPSQYIIKETDVIPETKVFPGSVNMSAISTIVSDGLFMPSMAMFRNPFKWQTDWEVIMDYSDDSKFTIQVESNGFWTSPVSGTGSDFGRVLALFSLSKVKEGEKFAVQFVNVSELNGYTYGPQQSIVLHSPDGGQQYAGEVNPSSSSTTPKGATVPSEGTLIKDLGDEGAIIDIGGTLTGEQLEAIKQIEAMAAGTPLAGYATTATTGTPLRLHVRKINSSEPARDTY